MSTADGKSIARSLAGFLKEHGLFSLLPEVIAELLRLDGRRKVEEAFVVRVAQRVSEQVVDEIRAHLNVPKDVPASIVEDPDIIGGFVARFGGEIYDASYASRIRALAHSLNEEA